MTIEELQVEVDQLKQTVAILIAQVSQLLGVNRELDLRLQAFDDAYNPDHQGV